MISIAAATTIAVNVAIPSWSRGIVRVRTKWVHGKEWVPVTVFLAQAQLLEANLGAADALVVIKSYALLPHHYDDCTPVNIRRLWGWSTSKLSRWNIRFCRMSTAYLVFKTLLVARLQRMAHHSSFLLVFQPFPILYVAFHIRVWSLVTINGQKISCHNNLRQHGRMYIRCNCNYVIREETYFNFQDALSEEETNLELPIPAWRQPISLRMNLPRSQFR